MPMPFTSMELVNGVGGLAIAIYRQPAFTNDALLTHVELMLYKATILLCHVRQPVMRIRMFESDVIEMREAFDIYTYHVWADIQNF